MTVVGAGIYASVFALLVCLSYVDIKTRTVPNWALVVLIALWVFGTLNGALTQTFTDSFIAALIVGSGLTLFTAAFEALRKCEALGGGDIKLLSCLALFLGTEATLYGLAIACVVAGVWALCARKHDFPFVPAITLGVSVVALAPILGQITGLM